MLTANPTPRRTSAARAVRPAAPGPGEEVVGEPAGAAASAAHCADHLGDGRGAA